MAILKYKMCGGDLNITADEKIIECEYCGSTQTIPDGSDEKKTNLFNRANRLRMDNEFDKAAGVYESIVSEFPEEAEGYWGLVLCSYGIEYVDDAKTGKKIPTCHRTLTSSVMDDDNFTQACENADVVARGIYREEAKAIDKLQQRIIAVVENEEPYDVFICYKETDDITKSRTEDSLIAQDIYTELIKEGYKVFFSRVTLRDKAGTEYEPYIYAALKSAKIMLAIGTKFDYYDAVWVKNEWSRYISMMADDSSKHLIPCFKNLDAYDIPKEFKNLQALDMREVTFFKNLTDNVERFIPKQAAEQSKGVESQSDSNSATIDSLLKRVFMFLEDGSWDSANEYCEKVLDINPECAKAYLGKLMAELKVRAQDELKNCEKPFDDRNNYQKAIRFADEKLKTELKGYISYIKERNEEEKNKYIHDFIKKQEPHCVKSRQSYISAGRLHTVGLKLNGTLVATGCNEDGICNVNDWTDIVTVSAGWYHTVGLKSNGTVVAIGEEHYGQCNVHDWKNIVAISTGLRHTVGFKSDGRVVAIGYNECGQCNVADWTDVVAISAGDHHTVGLKSDGTVIGVGDNFFGQCNVSHWNDIVAISAGGEYTVGLKSDGTVVAVGEGSSRCNINNWKNIVAISAGGSHAVGLKSDGTVVAVGDKGYGQCNVADWTDVVAISAGDRHTVGLKSDGTVIATGYDEYGQCNVDDWKDIIRPIEVDTMHEFYKKREEIALEQKRIEQDKIAREKITREQKQHEDERILEKKRIEEEKCKQIEQRKEQYRNAGLCQHCGGIFKGFFTKTCTKCGKKKDY